MCNTDLVVKLLSLTEIGPEISRLVPLETVLEFQDATVSTKLNLGSVINKME